MRMPAVQIVHLEPEAPAKPAPGAACNGCGVCCAAEPCPLGMVVSLKRRGSCEALRWNPAEARYRCALLEPAPTRALVARWIGAGRGCDSACETAVPGNEAIRQSP